MTTLRANTVTKAIMPRSRLSNLVIDCLNERFEVYATF